MRTNIVIDDELLETAFKFSKAKTKKDLIHEALEEFIRNRKKRNLMDLDGKIVFEKSYDYKASRENR